MQSVKTLALWGSLAPCFALVLSSAAFAQSTSSDSATPAQQTYQDQQQQYQTQERKYEAQADRYEAARDHYTAARAMYHRDRWSARYEHRIIVDTSELMDARVQTANGHVVGHVEEIARGPGNHVNAVRVALDRNNGEVWVDSGDLRFDADNKIVMTDLDREDLRVMSRETY